MNVQKLSALVTGAALVLALGGCGSEDVPVEPAAPTTQAPPTTQAAPTTEDASEPTATEPTSEPATASPAATPPAANPTTPPAATGPEEKVGDLPTNATAYADAFIQAWRGGDPAEMGRFATSDAMTSLAGFTPWHGAEWLHVSNEPVDGAGISGTLAHYRTADNQLLTISLDNAVVEAGGERGVLMAEYSLGAYPIPTDVESYAMAFLSAVGTGDTEFALQLGPADGFASADLWESLTYGLVDISEGGTEALVTVPFQEGGELQLAIDRATAEAGEPHAIISVIFFQ